MKPATSLKLCFINNDNNSLELCIRVFKNKLGVINAFNEYCIRRLKILTEQLAMQTKRAHVATMALTSNVHDRLSVHTSLPAYTIMKKNSSDIH